MICSVCGDIFTSVVETKKLGRGIIQRVRSCENCSDAFITYEKAGCPVCGAIGQVTQTQKIGGCVKRWRQCQHCDDKLTYTTIEAKEKRPVFTSSTTSSTTSTTVSTTSTTSTTDDGNNVSRETLPQENIWEKLERESKEKPQTEVKEDDNKPGYNKTATKSEHEARDYKKFKRRGTRKARKNS